LRHNPNYLDTDEHESDGTNRVHSTAIAAENGVFL